MGTPLYTPEILRLALATAHFQRLDAPQASAERRSPICGSRVTVDVALDAAGAVAELGQEVRACALGQASAALLDAHARGLPAARIAPARDALKAWLGGDDHAPDWPGLDILGPARAHPARHAAILLPFDALTAAIEAVRAD